MFSQLFWAFYRRKATAEEGGAMWSSFIFLFVNLPRGRQRSRVEDFGNATQQQRVEAGASVDVIDVRAVAAQGLRKPG